MRETRQKGQTKSETPKQNKAVLLKSQQKQAQGQEKLAKNQERQTQNQEKQVKNEGNPNALIIGTGEYTTGFVGGDQSKSDKGCGVIGLVCFDLRSRGLLGERVVFAGTNGTKYPGIRQHFKKHIDSRYKNIISEFQSYPADNVQSDPQAYLKAAASMSKGDLAFIFTPDDVHYQMIKDSLEHDLHVLATKPMVKTLKQHWELVELAQKKNRLLQIEVHKRFDPMYQDAWSKIRNDLGEFGYFYSYMSQPKFQLETFRAWAGTSSDISYYLNSHHVDFLVWGLQGIAKPVTVYAVSSSGQAHQILGRECEDTITLTVQWLNLKSKTLGTSVHTASWSDERSDVHSQQHFYYQGFKGFLDIDQAHRGYKSSIQEQGFKSVNPLYMKYTPNEEGNFSGQNGYGYVSLEKFVRAAQQINLGQQKTESFDGLLPTARSTLQVTAILEAGRLSIDQKSKIDIIYQSESSLEPLKLQKSK